jgi:hypothetical protein
LEPRYVISGALLVAILIGMGLFFLIRQWQTLRGLRIPGDRSPEDRRFTRNQAWRRLLGSLLMLVLAAQLAGFFILERPVSVLQAQGESAREKGEHPQLDTEQRRFLDFYRYYLIICLLTLLAMISLAAVEYFAIRRFGKQQYRQIQADRRAMIENELTRLRSQRNGHG